MSKHITGASTSRVPTHSSDIFKTKASWQGTHFENTASIHKVRQKNTWLGLVGWAPDELTHYKVFVDLRGLICGWEGLCLETIVEYAVRLEVYE